MITSHSISHQKRYLSPRFLINKVREKGVIWCAKRLLTLVQSSLYLHTRTIRAGFWYGDKKQAAVLYAFYDLAVSPPTFDIVAFLVLAELERREAGCSSLHVVIVPGPAEGFRAGDLEAYRRNGAGHYNADSMRWRLGNILVPCCWLIPSCQQVTICTSREEAIALEASLVKHTFPKSYAVRFPRENYSLAHVVAAASCGFVLPSVQATSQASRYVSDWIQAKAGSRKVITITLRECSYEQDRNSSLKDWGTFARGLDSVIYFPVIVRDTEVALKPLPVELSGLTIFPEAAWNVELRAALYELSYLNMSVSSGPSALCTLNRGVRYLIFKVITPSCGATTEEFFRGAGIEPGSQLPWASPFQRCVWDDDRVEVIQKAFWDMRDRIEKTSEAAYHSEAP